MRRIVPLLRQDFPTQVCVHVHEMPVPPQGQRLPLFVLVSRQNRVVVVEGRMDYDELKNLIGQVLSLRGESGAADQ